MSDRDIWNKKFKNEETAKSFNTLPGPTVKMSSNIRYEMVESPHDKIAKLESKISELEEDLKKIKKYINYNHRNNNINNKTIKRDYGNNNQSQTDNE